MCIRRTWIVFLVLIWATTTTEAQQLMESSKLAAVRASLPVLEDDDANGKLHADEVIWYDTTEIPPAYQHQAGNGHSDATFHSPAYNISADPSDAGKPGMGNAGNTFPWTVGRPGGAHRAVGVKSVKGFYFSGPAAVFRRNVPGRIGTGNTTRILDWVFADGTIFFEVIYQRIRDEDVVFEVRSRTKVDDTWEFDVFRPFDTAEALAKAIEKMGDGPRRAEAIADLRTDQTLPVMRLVDNNQTKHAFDATTEVYSLPLLKTDDVVALLERPFVSCMGVPFKGDAYAPSNDTEYVGLVPPQYHGAFVSATGTSADCMQCHDTAVQHATVFERPRGWYGRTPGSWSEKINSWHPVEPSSIAYNGAAYRVRLRQSFIDNGLVVRVQNQLPAGYKFTKVD